MRNLLEETISVIERSGQKVDDIVFIGSRCTGHECSWPEFKSLADKEYDAGFGAAEVASDLEIIFKNGGFLYREEYDGSEGWVYVRPFVRHGYPKKIKSLFADCGWEDLEQINE